MTSYAQESVDKGGQKSVDKPAAVGWRSVAVTPRSRLGGGRLWRHSTPTKKIFKKSNKLVKLCKNVNSTNNGATYENETGDSGDQ